MYLILLNFSVHQGRAIQFLEGHKAWIQSGFDDGVFLLAGSLEPDRGGAILAHQTSLADLQMRVKADPFVAESVVSAEIFEISPGRADERLQFLLEP